MKKTIFAAIVIAVSVTLFSCDWFSSKKSPTTIIGTWKLDSLYPTGKDSNSLSFLIFAMAKTDSSIIQFNADSTFSELYSKDSSANKYYVKGGELFLQEDTTYVSYQLSFPKDSIANLISKDSLVIVLKKK
jgi:hypothetical protein